MTVVTRFAPSPTGYLHVGGARTALYAFLYAKKMQGKFILRIEDTDRERSTAESVQAILDAMIWLDLPCDAGPYYQSQRFARYQAVSEQLLTMGAAYRCTCSKERLEVLREDQLARKEKPRYDGFCRERHLAADVGDHVIRFKNPLTGSVAFDDLVRGHLVFQNAELDDLVLVRSDGVPTYNFSVVVDDADMGVTHVIRGDDHINNTPRQINILQTLGYAVPQYAHVSMILGSDGKRLSKRHGAVSVMQYRDEGYLPEALLNYLVRLGWSHGDQEIFSLSDMIELFDLQHISRAAASFNPEKLLWLNQHYIKALPPERVAEALRFHMTQSGMDMSQGPALPDLVIAQRERVKTLRELAEKSRYFYTDEVDYDIAAVQKNLTAEALQALAVCQSVFAALTIWEKEPLHAALEQVAMSLGLKLGKVAQPLRVALSGGTVSPPMDVTLVLLGRERVLGRLARVLAPDFLQKMQKVAGSD